MDLSILNDKQREAVETTEGPLLVLAGAGSGKTRVLTHRIAYLIQEKGVAPWHILALTFTNKAAGEMRERVGSLLGSGVNDMWVMTFHACCARILRSEIEQLGYERTFVIYDDADQQSLLKKIIRDLNLNEKVFTPRELSSRISEAKNQSLDALSYLREGYAPKEVVAAYQAYQKQLKQCNALDFDDLLLMVMQLLNQFPDVLEKYRSKFRYILVDEYQDTNLVQYHIVKKLASEHRNLCVVGDDDQSIYGWRGADIRNILEFEKDFPGAAVIRLEQNYRSTEVILNAANIVISNNRSRKKKELWTNTKGGEPIDLYEAMDERDEANRIANRILEGARYGDRRYDDYAILYRTHAQSRIIEMYLQSYDIPYRVYGGLSFFQRAEVKDIVAYLRLLQNSADDVAFLRVINVPRRGIGDTSVDALQAFASARTQPLLHAIMQLHDGNLAKAAREKFTAFAETLSDVYMQFGVKSFPDVVEYLLQVIGYDAYLQADRKENYEARADIVKEFVGYIREFTDAMDETKVDVLSAFLENVALFSATDAMDDENGRVSMMTLHSAKGLEFPVVFLCGLEDGLFPSMQSIYEPEKLEEERRLCYVGITRARQKLYLSSAKQRMLYGKITPAMPSRFLTELEDALPAEAKPAPKQQPVLKSAPPQQAFGISVHSLKSNGVQSAIQREQSKSEPKAAPMDVTYAPGQRVRHKAFGDGTVLAVNGAGASSIVEIAFDNGANKKFAAGFAPIEVLKD